MTGGRIRHAHQHEEGDQHFQAAACRTEDIGQMHVERLVRTEVDVVYQYYSIAFTCRYW